jgi:hypothetical protein
MINKCERDSVSALFAKSTVPSRCASSLGEGLQDEGAVTTLANSESDGITRQNSGWRRTSLLLSQ